MRLAYAPYNLKFKAPAGTSRGILNEKQTYLIKIWDESDPSRYGIGEASLFRGLSAEDNDRYEFKLVETLANVALGIPTDLSRHSSIQFGLEQAIFDFSNGCKGIYFPSDFTAARQSITINGLVWMGSFDEMIERIEQKISQGFKCVKLKIGAIDFIKELEMVKHIRRHFDADTLEIRVDANGGFSMDNAIARLARLAELDVHSIEQPIRQGHWDLMAFLCRVSPLDIALDEELIGITDLRSKIEMLDTIRPKYIILKPSLCGGFSGAMEWIKLADERNIGWWVTSSLESNIGLNALSQWVATLNTSMPQGLGTGGL
ncbi:MAG: o-succinylbenzoate synthase, partial [Muribaculaceae bacterium]|nr:o-succinylbenzoate synthase [Muribaculaceae bacterium]